MIELVIGNWRINQSITYYQLPIASNHYIRG